MQAIDRAGTFRGKPVEWGVSETKNGYPQFVLRLQAIEYYDEEAAAYIPWAEYEQEATGYLVLYTKDKNGQWQELLNAKQIKKVFGWSGLDFESLAEAKLAETILLFRIEDSEYNGSTSLKLTWIDSADSNPVKQLPKYDAAKLKGLTAKMGGALQATAAAPTPATAAKAPAKAPAKGKKPLPKADAAAKSAAPSTDTPPPASPATASPAPSAAPALIPTSTLETKDSAWTAVNEACGVSDEKLAEVWIAVATSLGKPEEKFTAADWKAVKDAVLVQTSKF
jgi:hypothetical protein